MNLAAQPFRLASGGLVDRTNSLTFSYDDTPYSGYPGDTLASALLANGIHLTGRSFKYHRPRGIYSAGAEEPNALVQLARGARTEPNVRATTQELYDGLTASSQNCWPSVRFDVGAFNNAISALIPAGFYYKTFMWPPSPKAWLRYEHAIRRAAGLGRAADRSDPDHYEHRYAHCDVLVVGGGLAGLAAARAAAAGGARVIVCDEQPRWGGGHAVGSLVPDAAVNMGREHGAAARPGREHADDAVSSVDSMRSGQTPQSLGAAGVRIDGMHAAEWVAATVAELGSHPDITLLTRTTAFGYYDDNLVGALERVSDHLAYPDLNTPRLRLWKIRARRVVLATGAIERGIAYANNDRPGTLLASAARIYAERYGVLPGKRAVVFANNDSAHEAALVLHAVGVDIAALVDVRPEAELTGPATARARAAGIPLIAGATVVNAHGGLRVSAVDIATREQGKTQRLHCDLVCVSGGWNPAVHLYSQARGKLRYDETMATFVPDSSPMGVVAVGAASGRFDLAAVLVQAHEGGSAAAAACGLTGALLPRPRVDRQPTTAPLRALWSVPAPQHQKRFVDLQNDVTVSDVGLAAREGYRAVEHLKRYTTLGMGTDQGKTSNITGLALLAEQLGASIRQVGTTTFRPPYTPIGLGAVPGHESGAHVEPTRYSSMHAWHVAQGARFVNTGLWKRPHSYPRSGESEDDAANREALNVRTNVGAVDVSTLGKIELQGRDVAAFLNRIYINKWDTLAVGRCRYGVMLREDGMVMDDGTTSRLAPTHYLMTTTTVNAVKVMQQIEYLLQVEWRDLEVYATSVTEQWSAAALSGPKSRDVLARIVDVDVSNAAFPFLGVCECKVTSARGAIPARLFRMSYSGELAYEIHVPADRGLDMWDAVMNAGEASGIMAYGTEAMSTLRIEKGHIVIGPEADGRTTADDLGLGKLVNAGKWCIGKPLLSRPAMVAADRWQLVGLTALDGARMPRAAKLVADPDRAAPNPMEGHVTSWCYSPNLERWIALALLARGRERHGETVWAVSPLANQRVRVAVGPPCFIDIEGERLRV